MGWPRGRPRKEPKRLIVKLRRPGGFPHLPRDDADETSGKRVAVNSKRPQSSRHGSIEKASSPGRYPRPRITLPPPRLPANPPAAAYENGDIESVNRFVSLIIETRSMPPIQIKILLAEDVIRQVPTYVAKLEAVKKQNPEAERFSISDDKIHNEEAFIQMIEFLTFGSLKQLDNRSPEVCHNALLAFIDLHDLSVTLKITALEHAIAKHITDTKDIPVRAFVDFAVECYRKGSGHKIGEDSPLAECIKTYLSGNLQLLIESGAIDEVKQAGGALSKMLVEVLTENFVETQKTLQLSERGSKLEQIARGGLH